MISNRFAFCQVLLFFFAVFFVFVRLVIPLPPIFVNAAARTVNIQRFQSYAHQSREHPATLAWTVARHRQAAPLAGWLFQGAFASDVGVARTGFGAFALSFVLLMKTSRQEGGDSLRARREGDRAQEGDRALQIRRGPTECLDAKLGGGRHICKASTSICQVYQIANLNCKTIRGVFSSLFLQICQCKVYLQSPWRCSPNVH